MDSPKMCLRCGSKMDEVLVDLWRCMECDLGIDWNEYSGWEHSFDYAYEWGKWNKVPEGCLLVMTDVREGR